MSDNEKDQQVTEKKDTEISIGERIQKKRKALELSVEELASLTTLVDYEKIVESEKGLSSQTLYRYEKNEREPASREIKLLCAALNVSADWLIFGKMWNNGQEADSILASDLRAIVKKASDETHYAWLLKSDTYRDNTHQIKLMEIKNRIK